MYAGHFDFSVPLLGTIDEVMSPAECRGLLDRLAGAEWLPATVNSAQGRVVVERLRNNDLALVDDAALAADLFSRVGPHIPASMTAEWDGGERRAVQAQGLFVPLRVYRYRPGQHFGLHHDQAYKGPDGARSLLTLMVYLDEDCDGGETDFPEQGRRVAPRTGTALWFQHALLHAGLPVTRGVKHTLRTDVLFA